MSQVDWRRILVVQEDGYDSIELRKLARVLHGQPSTEVSVFDYEELPAGIGGNFQSVPDHENRADIEHFMMQWRAGWRGFNHLIDEVYPLEAVPYQRPAVPGSCSGHHIGSDGTLGLFVTFGNVPGAVAGCWHEFGHLRLHSLGIGLEEYTPQFFNNPPGARYVSAIRKDKLRPISACLHGLYAWCLLSEGHLRFPVEDVRSFLSLNVLKLEDGLHTQEAQSQLTAEGEQLMTPFYEWADDLIRRIWEFIGRDQEVGSRSSYESWKDSSPVPNDLLYSEGA